MSSHHIVRDEQEPALLIVQAHNANYEQIAQLLEWSPVVVVLEKALQHVLDWNIKINQIFTESSDIDSLRNTLIHQEPIEIFSNPKQDVISILQLLSQRHQAINLIIDWEDFLALDTLSHPILQQIDLAIFDQHSKNIFCRNNRFEKWWKAGTQIILSSEPAKTTNLKQLTSKKWEVTSNGLSLIEMKGKGFWLRELFMNNPF